MMNIKITSVIDMMFLLDGHFEFCAQPVGGLEPRNLGSRGPFLESPDN